MQQAVPVCSPLTNVSESLNILPVSIGISHNIMLARLATRKAKPDGVFHLLLPDLPGILAPLQLDDLHGFGRSAKQKATEKLGSCQLADLLKKGRAELCEAMGKGMGETLYNALRGVDERKLESDKPRKSVSCDINVSVL
jgi:DNA repair protein REV1